MRASVVIRVRDEAGPLRVLLEILAGQTAGHEVVVVDSGSDDGSADLARAAGARVLEIAPGAFSFGRALNLGTAACTAEVVVALSDDALAAVFGPLPEGGINPGTRTRLAHYAAERATFGDDDTVISEERLAAYEEATQAPWLARGQAVEDVLLGRRAAENTGIDYRDGGDGTGRAAP
jgi:glycosyltransferase involved in cell wall biosynthesis